MERHKYCRTFHLPFSAGVQSDDKIIGSLDYFKGKEVVALLKMDGENTTFYPDNYMHARSIDSTSNWTRDVAKTILSVIHHDIPEGYRVCCENLYAKHSIDYPDGYLEGYVYMLSVWNEKNECLSWDDTLIYADLLDLPTPKQLYRGVFDEKVLKDLSKTLDFKTEEGFVVRLANSFHYDNFSECVTKFVREGHVQTDQHWLKNATPNGIPQQPCKPAFLIQKPKKIKP
jgi:RNA ligase